MHVTQEERARVLHDDRLWVGAEGKKKTMDEEEDESRVPGVISLRVRVRVDAAQPLLHEPKHTC